MDGIAYFSKFSSFFEVLSIDRYLGQTRHFSKFSSFFEVLNKKKRVQNLKFSSFFEVFIIF